MSPRCCELRSWNNKPAPALVSGNGLDSESGDDAATVFTPHNPAQYSNFSLFCDLSDRTGAQPNGIMSGPPREIAAERVWPEPAATRMDMNRPRRRAIPRPPGLFDKRDRVAG